MVGPYLEMRSFAHHYEDNVMKKKNQNLVARLFIDLSSRRFGSQYAHLGVCFSFIANPSDPFSVEFASEYDLPKSLIGLDKMEIKAQLCPQSVGMAPPCTPFGYELKSSLKNMSCSDAEVFLRHGRRINKKLGKMTEDMGYDSGFKEYLSRAFSAMGVDAVLFEAKSEKDGDGRWRQYSVEVIDELVDEAIEMIASQCSWDLSAIAEAI